MTNDILSDNRRKRHIYMDSKLDDLPLTMEAYRVYCHLCRRAGCDNNAFPSYKSIGEACFRGSFPNSPTDSLRRKAITSLNGDAARTLRSTQKTNTAANIPLLAMSTALRTLTIKRLKAIAYLPSEKTIHLHCNCLELSRTMPV
ncbi:hypothetical protein [Anabaena sp. CCY 9910]|uniref:hypothetical protein n=1 Tax=Anabaena sp. CCY 9910 TaxID=3103870 RepID=UPI0039E1AB3B